MKPDNLKIVLFVLSYNVHLEVAQCVLKSFNSLCCHVREIFMNSAKHGYTFQIIWLFQGCGSCKITLKKGGWQHGLGLSDTGQRQVVGYCENNNNP